MAILFADPLFVSKTFADRDLLTFFLPVEHAVHAAWRQGHLPLWMPDISFGRPLAANPNTAVFYPPQIAMAVLPFSWAFKFYPLFHLWLAGIGMFFLARFFGVSARGSFFSGVIYALGGPALSDIMFPNILPGLALLPFVLWRGGVLARDSRGRNAAVFSLVWGLDLLAGDVFTAGLAAVGTALIVWQESPGGQRWISLARLFLASLPGFLLAAIQLVPALLFTPYTVRALGRFPLGVAFMWSVSPWRLLEFLSPFPFGNAVSSMVVWGERLWYGKSTGFFNTFSMGTFAAAAFLWLLWQKRRRLFPDLFALLSFGLASIGYFLPRSWTGLASPVPLRYPEKLMVGVAVAVALFAGMGVDQLRRRGGRQMSVVAGVVALVLAAVSLFFRSVPRAALTSFIANHWGEPGHWERIGAGLLPGIFFAAAVWWFALAALMFFWRRSRERMLLPLCLVFVLVELGHLRLSMVNTTSNALAFSEPASARLVRRVNHGTIFGYMPLQDYFAARVIKDPANQPLVPPNDSERRTLMTDGAAYFGIRYTFNQDYDVSDFYRVDLARQQIYRDGGLSPGLAGYLAAFSVRCAVVDRGATPNGFSRVVHPLGSDWLVENPAALPGIRLARNIRPVPDIQSAYHLIHTGGWDLLKADVVEGVGDTGKLSGGRVEVQSARRGNFRVRTQTPGPARLVLPMVPFPYREARVDGRPVPADATDLCLTSIAVPAGTHEVVVRQQLPGGALGPALSACGALIVLLLCVKREGHA